MSGSHSQQAGAGSQGYAGDVNPKDAWEALTRETGAQLVDVRTVAEWNFVGVPDLASRNRQAILVEWQRFPPGPNPDFAKQVEIALKEANYQKGAPLFFICRSGGRSRAAAIAMTSAGYSPCFNVADGFEGALDGERHRGASGGWKALGLPWIQS